MVDVILIYNHQFQSLQNGHYIEFEIFLHRQRQGQLQQNIKIIFKSMRASLLNNVEQQPLEIGNLVWAKVTGYPWWPAIITNVSNKKQLTYRVDFIADTTHAFLPLNKIVPYQSGLEDYKNSKKTNKYLQKAVAAAEQQISNCQKQKNYETEELKLLRNEVVQQNKQANFSQFEEIKQKQQIMEEQQSNEFKIDDSSQSVDKKQANLRKQKFVYNLLNKYNLFTIPKVGENKKSPRSKKIKHTKKQEISMDLKTVVIKKIYGFLKQKNIEVEQRQNISIKLAQRALQHSGSKLTYLQSLYRWLKMSESSVVIKYHSNWQQFHKINDQNGSSMTASNQHEAVGVL